VNERPAEPPPTEPPLSTEPSLPPAPDRNPLGGFRSLQILSILLMLGGLLGAAVLVLLNLDLFRNAGNLDENAAARAAGLIAGVVLGFLAATIGAVMNALRAVAVRRALPSTRYRGPSISVLLLIALVIGLFVSLGAGLAVAIPLPEGLPSILGGVLFLTGTQVGLLAAAGLFVAAPQALSGMRLWPEHGARRSMLLGLALAIPAWIGAEALALVMIPLLERVGIRPEAGVVDELLAQADPIVLVVALVFVAPVAEEIFFRGIVYNAWEREYGPRLALVGSALLFAAIHVSPVLLVPILGLGLALGFVYRTTRSLPATILLHAGFNAITVAIGLLVRFEVIKLPT
jgi:CAAX protease family protein